MHPESMQDTSRMRARCAWNVYDARVEQTQDTSVLVQNLTIKLQQYLINCHALFDRHWTHPEKHSGCV